MQAIVTKHIAPTNTRGARIKATCQARSLTLSWDHAMNPDGNHRAAALALATELGWYGRWTAGDLPDGATAWTLENDYETFTVAMPETLPAPPAAIYAAGRWISSTD